MSTRKQTNIVKAVSLALVGEPVETIAAKLGVTRETASRYLHSEQGAALLEKGQEELLALGRVRLAGLVEEACSTLTRNLNCGTHSAEVRAAVAILNLSGVPLTPLEKILSSPYFKMFLETIGEALKGYPDAQRAFGQALWDLMKSEEGGDQNEQETVEA